MKAAFFINSLLHDSLNSEMHFTLKTGSFCCREDVIYKEIPMNK